MKRILLATLVALSTLFAQAADIVDQLDKRLVNYKIAPDGTIKKGDTATDPTLEWEIAQYIAHNSNDSKALQKLATATSAAAKKAKNYDGKYLAALILGRVGSDSDIPLLADYLADKELFPAGRNALEMLGTPAAIKALIDGLGETPEEINKIAIVESLGRMKTPDAVNALAAITKDSSASPRLKTAAFHGLALIATPEAIAALNSVKINEADGSAIATITLARSLIAKGDKDHATTLLQSLINNKSLNTSTHRAAIRVSIDNKLSNTDALVTLLSTTKDKDIQQVALDYFGLLPAAKQSEIIKSLLADPSSAKTLQELSRIQYSVNKTAIIPLLNSGNAATRRLTANILVRDTDADTFNTVAALYLKTSGDQAKDTLILLGAMPSMVNEPFAALLAKTTKVDDQIKLLALARLRGAATASDAIIGIIENTKDDKARTAAYSALATTGADPEKLLALLASSANSAQRRDLLAALKTSYRNAEDKSSVVKPAVTTLASVSGITRDTLLTFLAESGNTDALSSIWNIYSKAEPATKATILRALAKWPDSKPTDQLAKIAKTEDALNLRVLATRAYIDQLGRDANLTPKEKLSKAQTALGLCERDEERLSVLAFAATIPLQEARKFIDGFDQFPGLSEAIHNARKNHNATMKNASTK